MVLSCKRRSIHSAVCGVQRKTTTFHFSMQENKAQMISEVPENNIKILDSLLSEKLQITYTF